jgi:acid stress-induced BolA-like protein IbaG/YrbA
MDPEQLKDLIAAGLDTSHLEVSGDGRHFEAVVVSKAFEGKPVLKQHRLIYAALGDRFDTEAVHALSIKTYTPRQWEKLEG